MKEVKKRIKRKTRESAFAAMQKHIEKMKSKGWIEGASFAGDAFLDYEYITYFFKLNEGAKS